MPLADHGIARLRDVTTRSISPENLDGGKGGGGRASEGTGAYAARDLGPGWKVSPWPIGAEEPDGSPGSRAP